MAPPRDYGRERPDALTVYLREIGQVRLLTAEEERSLARRVQRGNQDARLQMIKANLRLVVKIAHDYEACGLPLLDLINEGNVGLMKAVERFDPRKGAKLSTYAALWIKQSIRRALSNQSKTIRLPVHVVDKVSKLNRVSLKLSETYGREPTDQELAEELSLTVAKVAHLRNISLRPTSLDAAIGGEEADGDGHRFGDIIEDSDAATPYDLLRTKSMRQEVRDHLTQLDDREAGILTLRFGLDGHRPRTLEEVGCKFNVTRERIRQIQDVALTKLRRIMQQELQGSGD
ncbi:sigma-70 family RNA polymerase sigma factor [bacterium]|nr:sigma-70 family RNA polymerase sigma factor [bacterium]